MSVVMTIKLAIKSVLANKMRTLLTMLGIIIGTSAVIILVSVAQGTTNQVTENIESMGTNLISININGRGLETSIDYEEASELSKIAGIDGVSPIINGQTTVKYGTNSIEVTLEGADEGYSLVRDQDVSQGRFIHPLDIENRQKIVLLGSEVVEELFGFISPIGESVQLNGANFKVVGVLEEKASSLGGSSNNKVLIPISTAERFLKSPGVKSIYIQAQSPEVVDKVQRATETYLLKKFDGNEDAYSVFNQADMLSTVSDVTASMTLMLGGIAAISLVVGGIGIMNIMLVSVTERTREIGIRKAIGAKRKDILLQFILESAVISGLGGIFGVLLGIGGSYGLTTIAGISTSIVPNTIIIAFLFSIGVGMFFGIYPASKASKLKPVDALSFE